MATLTSRLKLKKAAGTENVSVADLNANWDLVDAAGTATICTSLARPLTPYDGQIIKESDTKAIGFWDAGLGKWLMWDTVWQPYVSTLTNFAVGTAPATALARTEYKRYGEDCEVDFMFRFGSNGSAPTDPVFTLPFTPNANYIQHNYTTIGYGQCWDNSASFATALLPCLNVGAGGKCQLFFHATQGAFNTPLTMLSITNGATTPFTWAVDDVMSGRAKYKIIIP